MEIGWPQTQVTQGWADGTGNNRRPVKWPGDSKGTKRAQKSESVLNSREAQESFSAEVKGRRRTSTGNRGCRGCPQGLTHLLKRYLCWSTRPWNTTFTRISRISLGLAPKIESHDYLSSMFSKCGASESHRPASSPMTFDDIINQIHFQRVKIYRKTLCF